MVHRFHFFISQTGRRGGHRPQIHVLKNHPLLDLQAIKQNKSPGNQYKSGRRSNSLVPLSIIFKNITRTLQNTKQTHTLPPLMYNPETNPRKSTHQTHIAHGNRQPNQGFSQYVDYIGTYKIYKAIAHSLQANLQYFAKYCRLTYNILPNFSWLNVGTYKEFHSLMQVT